MEIIAYTLLIIVIIVDLLFYIPLKIHLYMDNKSFYLYIFAIPIIALDNKRNINRLYNKISIDKIKSTSAKDLKIIHSIEIKCLYIKISSYNASIYSNIIYPLISLSYISSKFALKIGKKDSLYLCVDVKIINFIHELIKIRKEKYNERKSYQ